MDGQIYTYIIHKYFSPSEKTRTSSLSSADGLTAIPNASAKSPSEVCGCTCKKTKG